MPCEGHSRRVPLHLLDSQRGGNSLLRVCPIAVPCTLWAGNRACCLGDAPSPSAHYPGWQEVGGTSFARRKIKFLMKQ